MVHCGRLSGGSEQATATSSASRFAIQLGLRAGPWSLLEGSGEPIGDTTFADAFDGGVATLEAARNLGIRATVVG